MSHDDHIRASRTRYAKKNTHPYAAIEHRVIDSLAFSKLKNSSVLLLLLLARQLTKDNNGHLQATWSYCRKKGFGSENTLRTAIRDLIKHGFIHRTRSRGANKVAALYAVTWLPVKRKEGLFLHAFNKDGWKDWEEKNHPLKNDVLGRQFLRFRSQEPSKTDALIPQKSDDYELVPCIPVISSGDVLQDPGQWF